jgi:Zn-dependent protease
VWARRLPLIMLGLDLSFIIALVIAVTVHEFAHAWVANYFGDPTAKYKGRITLNPMAHLDVMGTLMLIFVGLGWGKPVPVNPNNLNHPKRDSALVSLAGPASNILMAIVIALPYKYLVVHGGNAALANFLRAVFDINLILALFNFVPLPPLDGSKIIGVFVPDRMYMSYQRFLADGVKYFVAFILIDMFIISDLFGTSLLWMVMGTLYQLLSSVILLGT